MELEVFMGRIISIVSGKGGVGKTTIACGVALTLAKNGYSVCIIDLDVGLNNIDMLLNIDNKVVYDIGDYMAGRCRLKQALINDSSVENLYVLPSVRFGDELCKIIEVKDVAKKLASVFDFVIIDAPAGVGENFENAIDSSNESIVVVTPHIASLRDADKVISKIKSADKPAGIVVNRIRGDMVARKEMLNHKQIEKLLKTQVLGVVPESDDINILSSLKFQKIVKTGINNVFLMLANNINQDKVVIYDYISRYKGLIGVVRRKLKRSV